MMKFWKALTSILTIVEKLDRIEQAVNNLEKKIDAIGDKLYEHVTDHTIHHV